MFASNLYLSQGRFAERAAASCSTGLLCILHTLRLYKLPRAAGPVVSVVEAEQRRLEEVEELEEELEEVEELSSDYFSVLCVPKH